MHSRPEWQQEAVARSLANGGLSDSDLEELTSSCKTEDGRRGTISPTFSQLYGHKTQGKQLHIISIGDVSGIENLKPRKPVNFGEGNLSVIYGTNGSGKSGYIRILKQACGKSNNGILRTNVFAGPPAKRSCTIKYKLGEKEATEEWTVNGTPLHDLACIDIFDSEGGRLYLSKESEASYTPQAVALFDDLVRACEGVRQKLHNEREILICKLPAMAAEYKETRAYKLYYGLKASHTEKDLSTILSWNEEDQKKLNSLNERLKTEDPARLASSKRKRKFQVDSILQKISQALLAFSPESCQKIITLKDDAKEKRKIATESAAIALPSVPLDGVGGDTWRALWEAARLYSEQTAYPLVKFPNTLHEARCVLCQQILTVDAKQRLTGFEAFVNGIVETSAKTAETEYQKEMESLPIIPNEEELITACQASGLSEEIWMGRLAAFWKEAALMKKLFTSSKLDETKGITMDLYPWIVDLKNNSSDLENEAKQHDEDKKLFDRPKAIQEKFEFQAKKWTAQQIESIKTELARLKLVDRYNLLIKGTDHTAITKKAGEVAEKVITASYINRFNKELEKLGAKKIKVELVKTRASRGKAMHAIRLRGATASSVLPLDILSDGEKRIVELAAFLADVMGRPSNTPFIFDDPISSLDQDFEERTADRLVELSSDRQVIVFTHRLSFLGIMNERMNNKLHWLCIRNEPWGTGEPVETPLFGGTPVRDLKKLIDERLPQAKKIFEKQGFDAYYPLAKAICSDFRILLERIIEFVLLSDVIQRHRRVVHTKNKIERLSKIRKEDCIVIDGFMTKYSCYEHSQSFESPVEVPYPEVIQEDLQSLLDWHTNFIKHQSN